MIIFQDAAQNTCTVLWYLHNMIWVRSRNCGCLVTWFCYQLIAKPGNKTATVPWPDPFQQTKPTMQIMRLKQNADAYQCEIATQWCLLHVSSPDCSEMFDRNIDSQVCSQFPLISPTRPTYCEDRSEAAEIWYSRVEETKKSMPFALCFISWYGFWISIGNSTGFATKA